MSRPNTLPAPSAEISDSPDSESSIASLGARPRRALLVLAPPRSGAGLLTQGLVALGATAGDRPRSTGERIITPALSELAAINAGVLAAAGRRLDDLEPLPPDWLGDDRLDVWRRRATELLRDDLGASPLFVVVGPALARLVPFWLSVLPSVRARPFFLHLVRHPLDVAASLQQRDGTPTAHGLLTWLRHHLDAEPATRSYPRAFVELSALVDNPSRALATALRKLGPPFTRRVTPELASLANPAHWHHRSPDDGLDRRHDLSPWFRQAYAALRGAARSRSHPGLVLDDLRRELTAGELAFRALVADAGRRPVVSAVAPPA